MIVNARSDRKRVILILGGTPANVFIGNSLGVTAGNGALLNGVAGQTLMLETAAAIYGIGAAAAVVSYIEEYA